MPQAKVKIFNGKRGYLDFPSPSGSGDLYFSVTDVDPADKKKLSDDDEVTFDVDSSDPAKPKAVNIKIVSTGAGKTFSPKGPKATMELFVEGKKGEKIHLTVRYLENGKPISTAIDLFVGNQNNPYQARLESSPGVPEQVITDLTGLGKKSIDISKLDEFVTHVSIVYGSQRVTRPIPQDSVPTVSVASKAGRFKLDPPGDSEERVTAGHTFKRNISTFNDANQLAGQKMIITSTAPLTISNLFTGAPIATNVRAHRWTTPKSGLQSIGFNFLGRSCSVTVTHAETAQSLHFRLTKR